MNPGPPAPQAGILNQARLRPHITGLRPSAIEGKIINTLIRLKNSGLAEGSLRTISYSLKLLEKNCNLDDSEAVKQFIANKKCDDSYKASLVKAYNYYVVINGIQWIKPKYKPERKIPKIPTTEAINKIISRASRKYATIFKILMETGVMPYELSNVTLRDIDLEKGTLAVQGFKGHASRIFKLKSETIAMLKEYLAKHGESYVTLKILFKDENRVDLNPTETIDLKFLPSMSNEIEYFIFEISGYNMKTPIDDIPP